ncbi:hypothetical protein LZ31DRAFT_245324 [Colletotrichum somersetense]|nr:hypothetical protein LZ31DRAFT_245324 [Colletotrichum somersetense]
MEEKKRIFCLVLVCFWLFEVSWGQRSCTIDTLSLPLPFHLRSRVESRVRRANKHQQERAEFTGTECWQERVRASLSPFPPVRISRLSQREGKVCPLKLSTLAESSESKSTKNTNNKPKRGGVGGEGVGGGGGRVREREKFWPRCPDGMNMLPAHVIHASQRPLCLVSPSLRNAFALLRLPRPWSINDSYLS